MPASQAEKAERSDVRSQGILARDIARIRRREHRGRVGEEAGPMDVGDHALIRGLGTASPLVRPGASRSYCGRRHGRPQSVRREFPCRRPAPTAAQPYGRRAGEVRCGALRRCRLHLAPDRPDKACQFTGHSRDRYGEQLAAPRQSTVAGAQSGLRLPGDVLDGCGQPLEHIVLHRARAGRMPVGPGTLD